MQWTSLNELREKYLSFFESKGHLRLPSFSLIPHNDKSLLLINSGMAPMKKYFTGEEEPPRHRVCTCQKCIRTPDLERVGHTARHGTFFEMLGNFSFGDYFKNEAIPWAWEFLTSKEWLDIPQEKLWPSIYTDDEEAFKLWHEVIGLPENQITRLGKEDNFWEHGSGPCGPCSEIYFDRGEKYGCGKPDCRPGCDCDRFMEIWNNVFSQFNNDGNGNYIELAQKNIDTGMGLERLACVMQSVDNMFEVDSIRKILDKVCEVAKKEYGKDKNNDISIRVITDHVRSAMFMISDGVIPSNEGRGYVLRRILRRACRHGKLLSIEGKFLTSIADVAIHESEGAYPVLREKYDYIIKVISIEEDRFNATIDAGLQILDEMTKKTLEAKSTVLSGEDAFKLYDTYGFPVDLTREIVEEKGLKIDDDRFAFLMNEQRKRAREARGNIGGWSNEDQSAIKSFAKTEFLGYEKDACEATVLGILSEGTVVSEVNEGECIVICDQTVFYGEGGGQVGDTGLLLLGDSEMEIIDTKKIDGVYLHIVHVQDAVLHTKDKVTLKLDSDRRNSIRRNHSACHLLQAALRKVLGTHVEQAGSYVDPIRVRFDFTHFAPMTKEELNKVEFMVNKMIMESTDVNTEVTDVETAKKKGAMALFGEKYGSSVRMVKMGDYSTELCGGTHVKSTGNIGLFKILSESSVAAGVRRIEGTTGYGFIAYMLEKEGWLMDTCKALKVSKEQDIVQKIASLEEDLKESKKKLESLEAKAMHEKLATLMNQAKLVDGVHILTAKLDMPLESVRGLGDEIKANNADMVALFATIYEGKLNFVAVCGKQALAKGYNAGTIVRNAAAICNGKGGGRPDSAVAGGSDLSKVEEALNSL